MEYVKINHLGLSCAGRIRAIHVTAKNHSYVVEYLNVHGQICESYFHEDEILSAETADIKLFTVK